MTAIVLATAAAVAGLITLENGLASGWHHATKAAGPTISTEAESDTLLPESERALARALLEELVRINTGPNGSTRAAAEAMAARLLAAGYDRGDVQVVGPEGERRNLVARLRGSRAGVRPILLMAHLDVVDARPEDWSFDPFVLREEGGWFYGRGTRDNKAGAATIVANMMRWKREGWVPRRDVIAVLTTDEETDAAAGIRWLLEKRRDLVDAAYCLNTDGGDGELRDGKPYIFNIQAAEKIYGDFRLEVRNRGGHSSLPRADNAIYTLANALQRLAAHQFPMQLTEVTRAYLQRTARLARGQRADDLLNVAMRGEGANDAVQRLSLDPAINALLRTTCVATQLEGGHAPNALPQFAAATVNCRAIPGTSLAELETMLTRVVADSEVRIVSVGDWIPSPPSPLFPHLLATIERLSKEFFPGASVIPSMSSGATDGLYLRNGGIPTYGVSALFDDPADVRAHGRDERISVSGYYAAVRFWYRMIKELADMEECKEPNCRL